MVWLSELVAARIDEEKLLIPFEMLLLPPTAFLIGVIAAMVGIGGGVFIVPLLSLILDFPSHQAVGTSLATIIFTSLSSTMGYRRQRRIDYKVGTLLTAATIPGAFVGAHLTTLITTRTLGLIFGFFLILVASRMTFRYGFHKLRCPRIGKSWHRKIVDSDGLVFEYDSDIGLGLALSFLGGLSSGLLGVGGGTVVVPILHLVMNFPMHVAVATSMFVVIFTSISGVITHFFLGNVHVEHALLLGAGIIFGAQLGAYISKRTAGRNLRRIFGIVLFLVSVRMIWKYM
jgi:hypothetical protein